MQAEDITSNGAFYRPNKTSIFETVGNRVLGI
jgi:hypothetical protein